MEKKSQKPKEMEKKSQKPKEMEKKSQKPKEMEKKSQKPKEMEKKSQKPKEELKEEPKEELKEEPKEEPKEELKEEPKEELKAAPSRVPATEPEPTKPARQLSRTTIIRGLAGVGLGTFSVYKAYKYYRNGSEKKRIQQEALNYLSKDTNTEKEFNSLINY
jgi:Mrp family chromosome partitioning ATPase